MALIEKEPIMEFIQEGLNKKHYGHVGVEIITEVEFAPIIDAVPVVHAKWEYVGGNKYAKYHRCSNCTAMYDFTPPYCPNCGAKMDKEKTGD